LIPLVIGTQRLSPAASTLSASLVSGFAANRFSNFDPGLEERIASP